MTILVLLIKQKISPGLARVRKFHYQTLALLAHFWPISVRPKNMFLAMQKLVQRDGAMLQGAKVAVVHISTFGEGKNIHP